MSEARSDLWTELEPIEEAFKTVYQADWGERFSRPISTEELRSLFEAKRSDIPEAIWSRLAEFLADFLSEGSFFALSADVHIQRHMRFLPAMPHSHEFVEIVYVSSGACRNAILGREIDMGPGDICVIAPLVEHSLAVFDERSVVLNLIVRRSTLDTAFYNLLTESDLISDFFVRILYASDKRPYLLFPHRGDDRLDSLVREMFAEQQENARYCDRMLQHYLMLFLLRLMRWHEGEAQEGGVIDERSRAVAQVLVYIEKKYSEVSLGELAGRFGYSPAYLSRLIRASTGRNYRDIVREIRLRKAAQLLRNPRARIDEIGETVGFEDPSHFYRSFKRYYGCTPAEYRRT